MRRLALLALFVVPWTILVAPGGTTLVFPWGLANPATGNVTTLADYLFVYASGFVRRGGQVVPLGTLLLWATAWWLYRSDLRGALDRE